METATTLRERFQKVVAAWSVGTKPKTRADFERDYQTAIVAAMEWGATRADDIDRETMVREAKRLVVSGRDKHAPVAEQQIAAPLWGYVVMEGQHRRLLNELDLQDVADLRDKIRFLVFRTATALLIAFVVVGAAYVARELGLALPLTRIG